MPEFDPILNLSTLNGTTGFQISGVYGGDQSGFSVSSAGDVNGDGFDDLIIGANEASPDDFLSGASYVVFGKAGGFTANLNLAGLNGATGFVIRGEASGDYIGSSVSSAGDVNGDGFDDLIVGAPFAVNNGTSYVVYGKAGGFAAALDLATLDGANGFEIRGESSGHNTGFSVSNAGDVNGDGFDDLIIGDPYAASPGFVDNGASYVVFGKATAFAATLDLATLDGSNGFEIRGEANFENSGFSVSNAGDVNGDGFADLIIGARKAGGDSDEIGSSYVVFGKAGGFAANLNLSTLNGSTGFEIRGMAADDQSGYAVSSAGDVNGDGFDDLLIGAPFADPNGNRSGTSYVVFGKAAGFGGNLNLSTLDGTNGFEIRGEAAADFSGFSVSDAGDVNGDGFDDVIVGASFANPNGNNSGASYVVFGKAGGFAATLDLSTLDGSTGFEIRGEAALDYSGWSVSGAGDVNGDGFDDLIVGAPYANPNGSNSGASYVIFGHRALVAVTRAGSEIAQTINGGFGNDRIEGGGGNDTLIGWEGNDIYTLNDVSGAGPLLAFDTVVEVLGAGTDTVRVASLDNNLNGTDRYTLAANVENALILGVRVFALDGNTLGNSLTGNGAGNALRGFGGDDRLSGGNGDDTMTGGLGRDDLIGGAGSDIFDFNALAETGFTAASRDRISGFTHLADDIDLSTIDAIPGGANDAFVFQGVNAFTAAGRIRLQQDGANTIVEINTVGANGAEATIQLTGISASILTAADFIL